MVMKYSCPKVCAMGAIFVYFTDTKHIERKLIKSDKGEMVVMICIIIYFPRLSLLHPLPAPIK